MPGAPHGRSAGHARSILLPVLALLLTLAACRQAPDPQPSGPIIPESTRVLDAETAASLTDFDPASGQLTFASDSPTSTG